MIGTLPPTPGVILAEQIWLWNVLDQASVIICDFDIHLIIIFEIFNGANEALVCK